MIDEAYVKELLRTKGRYLYHREGQELEFKEQLNLAGLAEYLRDFAAFANNRGGYLIFGVNNAPRMPNGLSPTSLEQFNKVDPERITGFLLEIFSPDIKWEQATIDVGRKSFGVFRVHEAHMKPVIAKKNEGKDQIIKNGEIYYRYGGRTQKIQFAELESIINRRVEQNNNQWLDLMEKIGRAGPQNAAILDTEKALIEKDETRVLVLDEDLAQKLRFIKEGRFVEKEGAAALKLIGDVVPVDKVEIIRKVKENLLRDYPFSAMELAAEVKKILPNLNRNAIWDAIADNDLKRNTDYATFNFRNKKQEDEYKSTGKLSSTTPCIYNQKAIDFLVNVLRSSS
jgi:predicted HTH transcriptional regulator